VGKRRVGRYPRAFRQMAVDRLRQSENVVALSEELGVHRRLLYKWRKQLEPVDGSQPIEDQRRDFTLGKGINELKRLLAEKTQEVDFFIGALQKIQARGVGTRSRGDGTSVCHSEDCRGTQAPILSANYGGASNARNDSESQTCRAAHGCR
jgi:transposase